jgi:uncharacterized protein (DUF849 family)
LTERADRNRPQIVGEPLILNLAPTGVLPTRAQSPYVPLQPDEIIRDVIECAGLGVTIAHLHVRDEDGRPSQSKDLFRRVIVGIREQRADLVICVSCSGRGGIGLEQRAAVLDLEGDAAPDLASLTLSSLNFSSQESVNAPATILALLERMSERGIAPELEIFDIGMANMARYLADKGLLPERRYANLLFGNLASAQSRLLDIAAVVSALPPVTSYSLAGIGAAQLPVAAIAAGSAHGVRVGLEDNLWIDAERTRLTTNADLVERVHRLAEAVGRPIMSPEAARLRFGWPGR